MVLLLISCFLFPFRPSTTCWVPAHPIGLRTQPRSVRKIFSPKWTKTTMANSRRMNSWRVAYRTRSCPKCWRPKQAPGVSRTSKPIGCFAVAVLRAKPVADAVTKIILNITSGPRRPRCQQRPCPPSTRKCHPHLRLKANRKKNSNHNIHQIY